MFGYLAGQYADSIFGRIGLQSWAAQYRGLPIASATIFDKGTDGVNEASLPFMESQNLHSWSVCIDRATFERSLLTQRSSLIRAEDKKQAAGLITGVQHAANISMINKAWAADVAIAPNTLWQLSNDRGKTWRSLKTFGDPRVDIVRYRITLVSQGVA
jgi:hypothetical protein